MQCDDCATRASMAVMRPASECGHAASGAPMKWCAKCSAEKKVCERCGRSLAAK